MALGARQGDIVAQAEIDSQFLGCSPVVLEVARVLIVFLRILVLDFVIAAVAGIAQHEGSHGVAAILRHVSRSHGGAVLAEVEDAVGRVGLDVIHLMQAAIEAEL